MSSDEELSYFDNGTLRMRRPKTAGIKVVYWPNGQKCIETTITNGIETGPAKTYHPNGSLASEGFMVNGLLQGAIKVWGPSGAFLGEKFMLNHKLISKKKYLAAQEAK